jgi:hypothetical protein
MRQVYFSTVDHRSVHLALAPMGLTVRTMKRIAALRDRIEEDGQIEGLPAGTFKEPGVYAVLISVMIPGRYR